MVEILRNTVKGLIPGSTSFVLFGLCVGVLLLFGQPRVAGWGRRLLTGLLVLYIVLSLQGTSDLLIFGLSHEFRSIQTRDDAKGAETVVVLSNGIQALRVGDQEVVVVNVASSANALEGARVYRLLGDPVVLVSGGATDPSTPTPESQALATALEQLGVPPSRIVMEATSKTTYGQVVNVSAWLQAHGQARFVLVTAPEHVRRATQAFAARGLQAIPSISNLRYGGTPFWWPTGEALAGSENAIYEYFAWCFYRSRGWL
jgi:uncharacterized SAM-binding protein YcdF (DUF218 family)